MYRRLLMTLGKTVFENFVRKGENAGHWHFFFPPTIFSNIPSLPVSISQSHILLKTRLKKFYTGFKTLSFFVKKC